MGKRNKTTPTVKKTPKIKTTYKKYRPKVSAGNRIDNFVIKSLNNLIKPLTRHKDGGRSFMGNNIRYD